MPDDTSLESVFAYAKQGPLSGGEFPTYPAVFVTFVEHFANVHPPGTPSDLVTYASGRMTLSQDKKKLAGEFKKWRSIFDPGYPALFDSPARPPDVFDDVSGPLTVAITISDSGQVTYQNKRHGTPVGSLPPSVMEAVYENGLFVEKTETQVRSLSFTFGSSNQ